MSIKIRYVLTGRRDVSYSFQVIFTVRSLKNKDASGPKKLGQVGRLYFLLFFYLYFFAIGYFVGKTGDKNPICKKKKGYMTNCENSVFRVIYVKKNNLKKYRARTIS